MNALTTKQLEQLKEMGMDEKDIIYQVHVTGLTERQRHIQDIPEIFVVVKEPQADAGIIAYGWSDGIRCRQAGTQTLACVG